MLTETHPAEQAFPCLLLELFPVAANHFHAPSIGRMEEMASLVLPIVYPAASGGFRCTSQAGEVHEEKTMSSFRYIQDPGHGWLEVPVSLLRELGIAEQITPYSYLNGNQAYLEEDKDMATFIRAMQTAGKPVEIVAVYQEATPIRGFPSYSAAAVSGLRGARDGQATFHIKEAALPAPEILECCCCGQPTLGRQWWNRDTGYGLCARCGDEIIAREGAEEAQKMAGERGVHWDVREEAKSA
ncbi:MAG: hypothetical protein D6757_05905 [Alphaproteobacteria bacterium]|nr:MAG: hypothetical protein D6757_05905 [Alphaproteobacteria bacterium]